MNSKRTATAITSQTPREIVMTAIVKPLRTPAETGMLEAFAASAALNDAARPVREAAIARIADVGLPGRRMEPWHYTDLRTLLKAVPPVAELEATTALPGQLTIVGAPQIVFSGARMSASGALPAGVALAPLPHDAPVSVAVPANEALVVLNSAFALASASLVIAPGIDAGAIHIAFRDAHEATANLARRVRIEVQAGASVTIIESHESRNGLAHLTNTLVEFELGDGAKVHHVRVNSCGDEANSLSTLAARVGDNANFATLSMTTGARVSRHQIFVRYAGEHAHVALRGVSLLRGKQHADTTLVIDHATPNCESREAFKTIVDGDATGVFQGRIVVAPHAQKTDARMSSKALLLSEGATMNNKPELEIFADDVQCAHGATCGELDDNLLFYIMARGLPKREAEALLLEAFVGDVIDEVEDENLREILMVKARDWLAERT